MAHDSTQQAFSPHPLTHTAQHSTHGDAPAFLAQSGLPKWALPERLSADKRSSRHLARNVAITHMHVRARTDTRICIHRNSMNQFPLPVSFFISFILHLDPRRGFILFSTILNRTSLAGTCPILGRQPYYPNPRPSLPAVPQRG